MSVPTKTSDGEKGAVIDMSKLKSKHHILGISFALLLCACGGGDESTAIGGTGPGENDTSATAPDFTVLYGPLLESPGLSPNESYRLFVKVPTSTGTPSVVIQVSGCSSPMQCQSNRADYDSIRLTSNGPMWLEPRPFSDELNLRTGALSAGQTAQISIEKTGVVLQTTTFIIR